MDLKARLAALQQSAGRLPAGRGTGVEAAWAQSPLARGAKEDRADQPAQLSGMLRPTPEVIPTGIRTAAAAAAGSPARGEGLLARALDAVVLAPGLLYREEVLSFAYLHGGTALGTLQGIGCEPLGVAIPGSEHGWLFMDTETSGLAGGTGTLVFLFGGVQVDGSGIRLRQWLLTRFAGEALLMTEIRKAFAQCRLLVSYNGKSFDLPLLRTRQRLHGHSLDESQLTHLDLLHPARSAFSGRWPDVRLQTAERRLCDFQRHDDLPGREAPRAFTRWLREGKTDDLLRVVRHHRDDVLSLVTLCAALCEAFRDPHSRDADEAGILRRLQRRGYRVRAGQGQLALATGNPEPRWVADRV